jgi:hypothetical protein
MPHKKPFRPFLDMRHWGIPDASWKTEEREVDELVSGRGRARLFLGCYGEKEIRGAIRKYSIQETLEERGLGTYRIVMDASNPDSQELRIFPVLDTDLERHRRAADQPLAEVILRESLLAPSESIMPEAEPCPYLVIQWICLQNPLADFDRKALLPGQKYPGLGVGSKVLEMLEALIDKLHLEGIINRPEFLHNALMYARVFRFVNPEAQGRLEALRAQLERMNLWQIAWAADRGYLLENGEKHFRWYQAEQVWGTCESLLRYFGSDAYRRIVRETREKVAYSLAPDTPPEYRPR